MKIVVIIQARMSSTRLPGKIMLPLQGKPMLQNISERIARAKYIDDLIIATSIDETDDIVEDFCLNKGIKYFRGSLNNVLERYYKCAVKESADIIIRCTADNALIDATIIDEAVETYISYKPDYLSYKASLPVGMRVEVFSFDALEKAYNEASDPECLEHVTPYIIKTPSKFCVLFYQDRSDDDYSTMRFTIDTPEDYKFAKSIYETYTTNDFSYEQILCLLYEHPEFMDINRNIIQKHLKYKGES